LEGLSRLPNYFSGLPIYFSGLPTSPNNYDIHHQPPTCTTYLHHLLAPPTCTTNKIADPEKKIADPQKKIAVLEKNIVEPSDSLKTLTLGVVSSSVPWRWRQSGPSVWQSRCALIMLCQHWHRVASGRDAPVLVLHHVALSWHWQCRVVSHCADAEPALATCHVTSCRAGIEPCRVACAGAVESCHVGASVMHCIALRHSVASCCAGAGIASCRITSCCAGAGIVSHHAALVLAPCHAALALPSHHAGTGVTCNARA